MSKARHLAIGLLIGLLLGGGSLVSALTWTGGGAGGLGALLGLSFVTVNNEGILAGERALAGTTNQITLTDGGANGALTLALPQDLDTGADLQLGSLGVGIAAPATAGDVLVNDALTVTGTNGGTTFIVDAGTSRFDDDLIIAATEQVRLDGLAAGDTLIAENVANQIQFQAGAADMIWDAGILFLLETTNINMGAGVTIQQTVNDDQILALKSSTDIATVLTTLPLGVNVETDDYFTIAKVAATEGGAYFQSLAETGASNAFILEAWAGSPTTTDTTADIGVIHFRAGEHDGANAGVDMAANSNLFTIAEIDSAGANQTRLLLKADDGELHIGGGLQLLAVNTGADIGSASAEFNQLYLGDSDNTIRFGTAQDVNLSRQDANNLNIDGGLTTDSVTTDVDAATTFAVASNVTVLTCTGAETIDTITGGGIGMILAIQHHDTDCTLNDQDVDTADTLDLVGANGDLVGADDLVILLFHDGTNWHEIARSQN